MSSEIDNSVLKCSFCGKPEREVKKLINSGVVFICNECIVDKCLPILQEDEACTTDFFAMTRRDFDAAIRFNTLDLLALKAVIEVLPDQIFQGLSHFFSNTSCQTRCCRELQKVRNDIDGAETDVVIARQKLITLREQERKLMEVLSESAPSEPSATLSDEHIVGGFQQGQ